MFKVSCFSVFVKIFKMSPSKKAWNSQWKLKSFRFRKWIHAKTYKFKFWSLFSCDFVSSDIYKPQLCPVMLDSSWFLIIWDDRAGSSRWWINQESDQVSILLKNLVAIKQTIDYFTFGLTRCWRSKYFM